MRKPLISKSYKRNYCDECKFEKTRRCGAKTLLKPSDALKDFDFTKSSRQSAYGTDTIKLGPELFDSHSNSGYSAIDAISAVECPS